MTVAVAQMQHRVGRKPPWEEFPRISGSVWMPVWRMTRIAAKMGDAVKALEVRP